MGQACDSHSGIHSQLQPLLDVHLDLSGAIFVKRFESAEHGIQPDQAADEVIEIHVPALICVTPDDHAVEMLIQVESCCLKGSWEFMATNGP